MNKSSYRWIVDLVIEYAVKLFLLILIVFVFNQVMLGNITTGKSQRIKEYIEVKDLRYHKAYQFFNYLGKLLTLDLGRDPTNNAVAGFYIKPGIINSSLLFFPSIIFSILIAYWIGKTTYLGKHKIVNSALKGLSYLISSIPIYWVAFIFFLLIIVAPSLLRNYVLIFVPLGILAVLFVGLFLLKKLRKTGNKAGNLIERGFTLITVALLYWIIYIFFLIITAGDEVSHIALRLFPPIVFVIFLTIYIVSSIRANQSRQKLIVKSIIAVIVFIVLYFFIPVFTPETGFNIGGTESWQVYNADLLTKAIDRVWHLILPWIPMFTLFIVVLSESVQNKLQQLNKADYINTARSKGFSRKYIFKKHLSAPIWAEIFSTLASYLPFFITYMVVVELVFYYQGLGYYAINKTYPVQNASILFLGIFVIVVQFLNSLIMKILIPYLRREQQVNIKSKSNYSILIFLLIVCLISIIHHTLIDRGFQSIDVFNPIYRIILIVVIVGGLALWLFFKRKRRLHHQPNLTHSIIKGKNVEETQVKEAIATLPAYKRQKLTQDKKTALIKVIAGICVVLLLIVIGFAFSIDTTNVRLITRTNVFEYDSPNGEHLMGQLNVLGEKIDYLRLILVASRYLLIPIISAILGLIVGTVLGVASGLWSSTWDRMLKRVFEFIEMIPSVLLLVIVLAFFNKTIFGFMFTLILIGSARIYRIVREEVILLRQEEFIVAVKLIGSNFWNILRRHIFPNIRSLFTANIFTLIADFILLDATLIYITRYTLPENLIDVIPFQGWGLLITSSIDLFVRGDVLTGIFPGIFLVFTIFVFRWVGNNATILLKRS